MSKTRLLNMTYDQNRSETLMSLIPSLIGFLLPMLVTVTADHLIKQSAAGEVVDSLITSLVFTGIFAFGVRLGLGYDRGHLPQGKAFLHGLTAGLVVQALIWGFWLSVPEAIRYSFGAWPFAAHLLLILGAGYAMSRARAESVSGA